MQERLAALLSRLWSRSADVTFIRHGSNHNFRVDIGHDRYFCRVYRRDKWSQCQIAAEHDFLEHLARSGLPVQAPVALPDGEHLVCLEPDGLFVALFDWIPGHHLPKEAWDPPFVFAWGQALGSLHARAKVYASEPGRPRRPCHDEVPWHRDLRPLLEHGFLDESVVGPLLAEADEVEGYLASLERTSGTYGLVHYDLHPGNLLVVGGKLAIIDFDDACYHWYAWDFAMPRHRLGSGHMCHTTEDSMALFVEGYRTKTDLSAEWEGRLRIFERIRHLYMLAFLATKREEARWAQIFPRYAATHASFVTEHPWPDLAGNR